MPERLLERTDVGSSCVVAAGPELVELGRRVADAVARLLGWTAPARRTVDLSAGRPAAVEDELLVLAGTTSAAALRDVVGAFLDGLAPGSLQRVVAVPVLVQAPADHDLAAALRVRPRLAALGARVPDRALFLPDERLDGVLDAWLADQAPSLRG